MCFQRLCLSEPSSAHVFYLTIAYVTRTPFAHFQSTFRLDARTTFEFQYIKEQKNPTHTNRVFPCLRIKQKSLFFGHTFPDSHKILFIRFFTKIICTKKCHHNALLTFFRYKCSHKYETNK
jgi:hypothetical protein